MKKLFTVITLMIVLLASNIADAKFSDEYRKAHPRNVKTWTDQLKSGKMSKTTQYNVFKGKPGGLSLRVSDLDGVKVCLISYAYNGDEWRFYDGLSWGDGKESHDIRLISKPRFDTYNRGHGAIEILTAGINPEHLKNAIVIHAHSERHGNEVIMNKEHKRWKEWQEAVDSAAKLMAER